MAEIPKLAPEVEIPRPRSSGVAVVAVAALAMFTAVGASAFVVRVRMAGGHRMGSCTKHLKTPPIAARLELRDAFLAAAARQDDQTALEIYRGLPARMDPTGELARVYQMVVARQMLLVERDLLRADCDSLRARVAWLRRVAPDEQLSVRTAECTRPQIVEVELVEAK
jgi:hypothetical protein